MNVLQQIRDHASALGYRAQAIQSAYRFNDFTAETGQAQSVDLAVFTQTPASYRSAAFAVIHADGADAEREVTARRALGAPLFFVVEKSHVSVWQVFGSGPSRRLERTALGQLDAMFEAHRPKWSPEAIHRAKSIGKFDSTYQLDFVDAGLLPVIEGQIHTKLDQLLIRVLNAIKRSKTAPTDERTIFQAVFRLLAAKVLIDRQHHLTKQWDVQRVGSVLRGIGDYYNLSNQVRFASTVGSAQFADAWAMLRDGINVANISSDDLAYVYENTLVSPQTRQAFSTHSTPRQVAEFIAGRLGLWRPESSKLRIYEPFTGGGVLLVAALRHMREALPEDWTDHQRHIHLVKHIRGADIDAFSCEVATLSLILADYPNTNGWRIDNVDLFEDGKLSAELAQEQVILCNPPFEALTGVERLRYPLLAAGGGTKAEAALRLAIRAQPQALGFVLPRSFLMDRAYHVHRAEIERQFADIEVVSLPDGVFRESTVESALLIAREPSMVGHRQLVRSSEVDDQDRKAFLARGTPSRQREEARTIAEDASGSLWIAPLSTLWQRVADLPTLGQFVHAHWGIRWLKKRQSHAASDQQAPGRQLGLHRARDHRAFALGRAAWLDVNPEHLYGGGDLPWEEPKILCNAGRSSPGKWRISAAVDRKGLVASQQYVALWAIDDRLDLDVVAAVINGPLANAYLSEHSADRRLRIATLLAIPMPATPPIGVGDLARDYARIVTSSSAILGGELELQELLDEIDAAVLDAYDLPPRMVRNLLASFREMRRPLAHEWRGWDVSESDPAFSLSDLQSDWMHNSRTDWPQRALTLIPAEEAAVFARYAG